MTSYPNQIFGISCGFEIFPRWVFSTNKQKNHLSVVLWLSGREDLNLRPLAPHASALAGLRHAPIIYSAIGLDYSRIANFLQ